MSALGIFGALLMILAGLVALNHSVLPFNGWPKEGKRFDIQKQQLPRAPVATGRLRTAPGGALAGALLRGSSLARGGSLTTLVSVPPRTAIRLRPQARRVTSRPVLPGANGKSTPRPATPAPAPKSRPVPVATPVPVTPVVAPTVVAPAPVSRMPATVGNGNGNGNGHSHAPGQLKKIAAAASAAADSQGQGNHHGNGNGGNGQGNGNGQGEGHGNGNGGGNGHGHGDGGDQGGDQGK